MKKFRKPILFLSLAAMSFTLVGEFILFMLPISLLLLSLFFHSFGEFLYKTKMSYSETWPIFLLPIIGTILIIPFYIKGYYPFTLEPFVDFAGAISIVWFFWKARKIAHSKKSSGS